MCPSRLFHGATLNLYSTCWPCVFARSSSGESRRHPPQTTHRRARSRHSPNPPRSEVSLFCLLLPCPPPIGDPPVFFPRRNLVEAVIDKPPKPFLGSRITPHMPGLFGTFGSSWRVLGPQGFVTRSNGPKRNIILARVPIKGEGREMKRRSLPT